MLLRKGDNNTNVALWQAFLQKQGMKYVVADASFGDATEKATREFQRMCAISADGIVGDLTISQATVRGFAGFSNASQVSQQASGSASADLTEKVVASPSFEHIAIFRGTTIEKINAAKLAKVAPVLQVRAQKFIEIAAASGVTLQIVQGLRTFAEQNALYGQGRTRPGKRVTNAIGGQSLHNYGLALDLAPVIHYAVSWDEHLYRPYGEWAVEAGLEWGGTWKKFKDLPHVQFTAGLSLKDIQAIYRNGGLAAVWKRIG
jgi:peptidoglycan hydrolase-like protein with peptidoglycan-binding domain